MEELIDKVLFPMFLFVFSILFYSISWEWSSGLCLIFGFMAVINET